MDWLRKSGLKDEKFENKRHGLKLNLDIAEVRLICKDRKVWRGIVKRGFSRYVLHGLPPIWDFLFCLWYLFMNRKTDHYLNRLSRRGNKKPCLTLSDFILLLELIRLNLFFQGSERLEKDFLSAGQLV